MKKIKELQKRSKLIEGRNYGVGFTILNKKGSKFETYLPFTACRDYLNDFAYVESSKKEIGSIHGYDHKLLNCFDNKNIIYFGVKTLNYNKGNGNYDKFDKLQEILTTNYKNLQIFLNRIETNLNVNVKTTIELDEDTLIIRCSKFWVKSTPLISVYTLLIRCYLNIDLTENKLTIDNLKENIPFINADSMMKKPCIDFYELYLKNKNKFINPNYEGYGLVEQGNPSLIHNFGIDGFIKKLR
jgi:hypothetical protein